MNNALEFASYLDVPVLLHTGEFIECKASLFMDVCMQYDHLNFVLAHGRPLNETKEVLYICSNTFVDTAFMPFAHVKELVEAGFTKRILYGTDAPINQLFYKDMTTTEYIKSNLNGMKHALGDKVFKEILSNQLYKN